MGPIRPILRSGDTQRPPDSPEKWVAPIAYSTYCRHKSVLGRASVARLKEQIERKEMQPSVSISPRMIKRLIQIPKLDPGRSA